MPKINARTNKTKRSAEQKAADRRMARMDPVAALILDPCNADVSPAFYNGEGGYTQRFVKTINVTTGGADTALNFAFYPGADMVSFGTTAAGSTIITNAFTTANAPGINYLGTNSNKFRAKAACVELWSSQAALNVLGSVGFGVLSASQYQSGLATTTDALVTVLTHQTKLTQDIVQCIWFPGVQDQFFNSTPNSLPSTALPPAYDDQNAIVYALTGLPVNTTFTFRITFVVEWIPKANLEIANVEGGGGNSQRTYEIVNELHRKRPGWYARLKSHAQQFANVAEPIMKRELKGLAQNYGPHLLKAVSGMII